MIERIASWFSGPLRALPALLGLGFANSDVSPEDALHLVRALGANGSGGGRLAETSFERIRGALLVAYGEATTATSKRSHPLTPAGRRLSWPRRSALVLGSLGVLLVGLTSAAVAESGPGHALYGARLALESITLPSADSEARVEAQVARLNLRVREAAEAAESLDERAVVDALDAYRGTLDEVIELTRRYPAARPSVAAAMAFDLRILEALERRLGARASRQLDLVISATRRAFLAALPGHLRELSRRHARSLPTTAHPSVAGSRDSGLVIR